jgi:dolichol-phosphate mannosyltransferase
MELLRKNSRFGKMRTLKSSNKNMELSILIPAKNEALSLPQTISNLYDCLNSQIPFNFIVVNDHSGDETLEVLENLSEKYPNFIHVSNEGPGGVGNAIRYGLERYIGDIVAICMADGSDAPGDVLKAYHKICHEEYDCVFGSRFMKGGSVRGYPIVKRLLNRIFNLTVKKLSSYEYNDFTNLFKLYRRAAIESISPLESQGFSIGLEMSMKAFKKNLNIVIVPISWQQRTEGKSKLNLIKNFRTYISTLKKVLSDAP